MALYRVNIPCNINVVLVVFCLHMFVAAKQLNSQTLEIKEKDTRWKKEQKTRAMYANANRTEPSSIAHIYTQYSSQYSSIHQTHILTLPTALAVAVAVTQFKTYSVTGPHVRDGCVSITITISSIPSIPSNNHFSVGLRCERVALVILANVLKCNCLFERLS